MYLNRRFIILINTFFLSALSFNAFSAASARGQACSVASKLVAIALDKEAIKKMSGCFEVHYNFQETRALKPNYTKQDSYRTKSLELISYEQVSEGHLRLQHILKAGPMMIHHWSQDWIHSPNMVLHYKGLFDGKHRWEITKETKIEKSWLQYVRGVSSEPRYSALGAWQHGTIDDREERKIPHSMWSALAPAPLPRRDYSKRDDYQVLERFNVHEVTPLGWQHEQHNKKIVLEEEGQPVEPYPLAMERGNNVYRKIDDSACQEANEWWKEQKPYWDEVENIWQEILAENDIIEIEKREGTTMFQELSLLIISYQEDNDLTDEGSKTEFRELVRNEIFSSWVHAQKKDE